MAGFLYQIVGVLGLRAGASSQPATGGDGEVEALISVIREGRIEHERFGQDAILSQVLGDREGLYLIQFKYSVRSPPRPVAPSEFDDIVAGLNASRRQVEADGKSVTAMVLLTNRPVTLPGDGRLRRSQEVTVRAIPETWLTTWRHMLFNFAREYGCRDEEIEGGIDSLIGFVHRKTVEAGHAVIETRQLVKAFTQSASSKPLTSIYLQSRCLVQLAKLSAELLGPQGLPVRRALMDELETASLQSALVIIEGTGGNGKSTALAAWASNALGAPVPRQGALVAICQASRLETCWVQGLICDYAEIPQNGHARRSERTDEAIERLVVANPNIPRPVLLLGLDGLDEGAESAERNRAIRETVAWFRDEDERAKSEGRSPIATLVVTCRKAQQVLDDWIDSGISGFPTVADPPQILIVGDFSDAELLEAVRRSVPDLYPQFQASIAAGKGSSRRGFDDTPFVNEPTRNLPSISMDTLGSLRHPVVWRAFLELPAEVRQRVLIGDAEARWELARIFTVWFCQKTRRRNPKALAEDLTVSVLAYISARSSGPGIKEYKSGWYEPARACPDIGLNEIRPLYDEAVSAGYIEQDVQNRWRWRHLMCPDYLSSLKITG